MPEPLLTANDLATYVGVPLATIYKWSHDGTGPPSMKVGKYLRYRQEDVEAWLEGQKA